MTTTVYILRLAGGNWYVGKTDNFQKRMEEHVRGGGSAWTSMHKVVKVEKVVEGASPFDEDRYVKEYMAKYGIDKVRGGSYVSERLDHVSVAALERELRGASDCCMRCGRNNHFVKDCYAKTHVSGKSMAHPPTKSFQHRRRYADEDGDDSDDDDSDDYDDDDDDCDDDDYYSD